MFGTGLEPRRTNCPPNSAVLYIACLMRCTPFWGTSLVMQPTCLRKLQFSSKSWREEYAQIKYRVSLYIQRFTMAFEDKKHTSGWEAFAEDILSCFLRAALFADFPYRSLALYWTLRNLSVEGFHVSVSMPLSIPTNFLECILSVSWSPRPPWAMEQLCQ